MVAVDRLANVHRFSPDLLLHFMETRLRMLIRQAGLPKPEVQWVVQDEQTRTAVWLDLAWPDEMIGT